MYLPLRKNTSIIYTSVDRVLIRKRHFSKLILQVSALGAEGARQILFKELQIKDSNLKEQNNATELVSNITAILWLCMLVGYFRRTTPL